MWNAMGDCIRKVDREVLMVSKSIWERERVGGGVMMHIMQLILRGTILKTNKRIRLRKTLDYIN